LGGLPETCDRCPDERDRVRQPADDELSVDVKDLTTEAARIPVTAGVGRAAETAVPAIHFDDEPDGRGEEVGDGVAEDDLATKSDAELAA
jgi:hypothetical protein